MVNLRIQDKIILLLKIFLLLYRIWLLCRIHEANLEGWLMSYIPHLNLLLSRKFANPIIL